MQYVMPANEFFYQTPLNSKIIYSITIIAVICVLSSLPFLNITVSIQGLGIIRTSIEKMELISPAAGRLLRVNIQDNQKVVKGTTLLIIDGTMARDQNNSLNNYRKNLNDLMQDAEKLIRVVNSKLQSDKLLIKTGLYASSWQKYNLQLQHAVNANQHFEQIFKRYQVLYQKNVVTKAEFEHYKFNYEKTIFDQFLIDKEYINQWQEEINQYKKEQNGLQIQKAELHEQELRCSLKATINGSIQNLIGIQEGSFIYANQKIAEISPDGVLFAYCYVKPSNIALIKKGQRVYFQIDAFNHNQWGMLEGKVIDISEDTIIQNQQYYFKIKCQLDKNYLQLKSGYRGFITKGMTFTASFKLSKRSLYQLLYDKIDDWVN